MSDGIKNWIEENDLVLKRINKKKKTVMRLKTVFMNLKVYFFVLVSFPEPFVVFFSGADVIGAKR